MSNAPKLRYIRTARVHRGRAALGHLADEDIYQVVCPTLIARALTLKGDGYHTTMFARSLGRGTCTREDNAMLSAEIKWNAKGSLFLKVVSTLH